jgi:hypothetical protein
MLASVLAQGAHGALLETEFVLDSLVDLGAQIFIAIRKRVFGGPGEDR